ncbi:MAG: aminotransferase class V-fold PLP-dependent enzyme [Patescibacteria group bacterium]|nr:aminotransferase class V-fold PLP-dependent enzyme [Patescibacteria group bacterium]
MQRLFFTAGPSQLHPSIASSIAAAVAASVPSWSHRGPEFEGLFASVRSGLKQLLGVPSGYEVLFFSSATEIWERLIQNCVAKTSFHFVNGVFGDRFRWTTEKTGRQALYVEVPQGSFFDLERIAVPKEAELIGITHNESSSGVAWQVPEIASVAKKYPDALIAVDVVSSLPHPDLPYELLDAVYFSVQKGFGLPAGLGVGIISPRAIAKSRSLEKQGIGTGSYHSFSAMLESAAKNQTVETPNVLNLFLLDQVVKTFTRIGLARIRTEIDAKATRIYAYFDAHSRYKPSVPDIAHRSPTLIVVDTYGESKRIVEALAKQGIEISYGYGKRKDDQIRIANFPAHSMQDIDRLLTAFDSL